MTGPVTAAVVGAVVALLLSGAQGGWLARAEVGVRQFARERGLLGPPVPVVPIAVTAAAAASLAVGLAFTGRPLWSVVSAAACLLVLLVGAPVVVQRAWHRSHDKALAEALPDLLRAWAMVLEGGATPTQGLEMAAARTAAPALRLEVQRVLALQRLRVGGLGACWTRRADALDSAVLGDVAELVRAVEQTGAPLAALLKGLADDIDARHRFEADVDAASAGPLTQVLWALPLVGVIAAGLVPWVLDQMGGTGIRLRTEHHVVLGAAGLFSIGLSVVRLRQARGAGAQP